MTDDGRVTVVIPQWNRADLLRILLKHLEVQTYPIHQTIVVDNGSSDDSAAAARKVGAAVIELGRNLGFAVAVNRGVAAATTEWVVILNNDVTVEPRWLAELVQAASRRGAWFATGKLLKAEAPAILDGTYDAVCAGGTAWRCGEGRVDSPEWSRERDIHFAPLTAALFRRSLFDRIGLLDERFESYLEDLDLGLRCAAAGCGGIYVPAARATHRGSATRGAWHKATVRQLSRNQIFITSKHFRGGSVLKILVAQLLWGLVALRHGKLLSWLRGKAEGLRRRAEFRTNSTDWGRLRDVIEESEREILNLQRRTGFDTYWRLYFMLTRGGFR